MTTSLGEAGGMIAALQISIWLLLLVPRSDRATAGRASASACPAPVLEKPQHGGVLVLPDELIAAHAEAAVGLGEVPLEALHVLLHTTDHPCRAVHALRQYLLLALQLDLLLSHARDSTAHLGDLLQLL